MTFCVISILKSMIDGIYSLNSFIERRGFNILKNIRQFEVKDSTNVPLKISPVQNQATSTSLYTVGLSKTSKPTDHVQEFLFNLS